MPTDFNAKADEFIARIQSTDISGSTEVSLIYHAVKADDDSPIEPFPVSITGSTTVKGFDSKQKREEFARSAHLATIIGNINSMVRNCPTGPTLMHETGDLVIIIQDIEMEIIQPES
jgi:hypothetical protein